MDASCNNTYNEDRKIIYSPNYPRLSPKERYCTWNIAAPIGFQISVEPFFYSIVPGFLKIYDPANSNSRRSTKLEGIDKYNGTTSTANFIFFEFRSFGKEFQGFQVTLSLIGMQIDFIYKRSSKFRIIKFMIFLKISKLNGVLFFSTFTFRPLTEFNNC